MYFVFQVAESLFPQKVSSLTLDQQMLTEAEYYIRMMARDWLSHEQARQEQCEDEECRDGCEGEEEQEEDDHQGEQYKEECEGKEEDCEDEEKQYKDGCEEKEGDCIDEEEEYKDVSEGKEGDYKDEEYNDASEGVEVQEDECTDEDDEFKDACEGEEEGECDDEYKCTHGGGEDQEEDQQIDMHKDVGDYENRHENCYKQIQGEECEECEDEEYRDEREKNDSDEQVDVQPKDVRENDNKLENYDVNNSYVNSRRGDFKNREQPPNRDVAIPRDGENVLTRIKKRMDIHGNHHENSEFKIGRESSCKLLVTNCEKVQTMKSEINLNKQTMDSDNGNQKPDTTLKNETNSNEKSTAHDDDIKKTDIGLRSEIKAKCKCAQEDGTASTCHQDKVLGEEQCEEVREDDECGELVRFLSIPLHKLMTFKRLAHICPDTNKLL